MNRRYEVLAHTADTGIVAYGVTVSEVFENAALAMFDLMFGPGGGGAGEPLRLQVQSPTVEDLLVDWLSTLLYEAESRDLAFRSFEVDVPDDWQAIGWARGVPSGQLELIGPPVKAVTYHDLVIERTSAGWRAQVVFDV